ncbi:MAG: tetratricopeptide repeat protein [Bacteroidetes bacterium]|jgi:tetratricopeptide (TPR) repeat protein|nr:tetratricopeptide repeat protein [Bacteroidota bacterium]
MNISANAEAEKILFAAKQLLAEGKLPEALDTIEELIKVFPDFSKAYILKAEIFFEKLKNSDTAEENFKKAITLTDTPADGLYVYARLLLNQERFAEALSILNRAMEMNEARKDQSYMLYGNLYEMQGKINDAAGYYKKCLTTTLSNALLEEAEAALKRCEIKKKYI